MKKLRLLVTEQCNKNCPGCCNKDWDLNSLEICTDFTNNGEDYGCIILTGGEPMSLGISKLVNICVDIRYKTNAPIYIYTAYIPPPKYLEIICRFIDGITLTLHDTEDLDLFIQRKDMLYLVPTNMSLRLNIFDNIDLDGIDWLPPFWITKSNIKWIKKCPLPEDEVFMRYI